MPGHLRSRRSDCRWSAPTLVDFAKPAKRERPEHEAEVPESHIEVAAVDKEVEHDAGQPGRDDVGGVAGLMSGPARVIRKGGDRVRHDKLLLATGPNLAAWVLCDDSEMAEGSI